MFTGKALKDALWKAARATYLREFEVALAEMEALSPKTHEWLLLDAREKPIITMLEIIRTKIMQRIAKKKVEADKWSVVPLMLVDTSSRFHVDHTLNMQWTCLSIPAHDESGN
ncbi:hypothetical protein V6N13_113149 [Hibiscus sabdariffa]